MAEHAKQRARLTHGRAEVGHAMMIGIAQPSKARRAPEGAEGFGTSEAVPKSMVDGGCLISMEAVWSRAHEVESGQ